MDDVVAVEEVVVFGVVVDKDVVVVGKFVVGIVVSVVVAAAVSLVVSNAATPLFLFPISFSVQPSHFVSLGFGYFSLL